MDTDVKKLKIWPLPFYWRLLFLNFAHSSFYSFSQFSFSSHLQPCIFVCVNHPPLIQAKRWVEYVTDSDGPGDWLSRGAGLKLQQAQEAEEAAAAAKGASSKSSSSLLGRSGLNAAMGAGQPGAAGASTTALRLLEEIEKEKQAAQKRAEDAQDAQDLLEEAAEAEAEAAAKEIADSMMMEKEAGTA